MVEPCKTPSSVGIATSNPSKVGAVAAAFRSLCNVSSVEATEPPRDIKPQPIGREVFEGALKRAEAAWRRGYDFGVGVEAGPIEFYTPTGWIEVQIAVIIGPGGRVSIGLSQGFEIEPYLLQRVLAREELGSLVSEARGIDLGESIGYIGLLTRGVVTRVDLTRHATIMALVPWVSGWWRRLPSFESLEDR